MRMTNIIVIIYIYMEGLTGFFLASEVFLKGRLLTILVIIV